jgi:hypothetical protein
MDPSSGPAIASADCASLRTVATFTVPTSPHQANILREDEAPYVPKIHAKKTPRTRAAHSKLGVLCVAGNWPSDSYRYTREAGFRQPLS